MTTPVLDVLEIEAVQSIQNLAHAMPLLAGRPTAVRVYVTPRDLPSSQHVSGTLELTGPNGAIVEVKSARSIRLHQNSHIGLASQRRNIRLAFHFPLRPDQAVKGPSRVRLKQVTPVLAGEPGISIKPNGRTIIFEEGPVFRLKAVGFRVRDPATGHVHVPEPGHFSAPRSFLERAFPASRVEWSQLVIDAPAGFEPPYGEGAAETERGGRWQSLVALACAYLMAIRTRDVDSGTDQRTRYYGLVHHPVEFFVGAASDVPATARPDVVGVGPAEAEASYTAHELGHMLGGLHPGHCGESQEDPDFPADFAGRLSSPALDCHGFDVGSGSEPAQVLPYDRWYDLMTYCESLWVSAYSYRKLLERMRAEDRLGADACQGRFVQVIGTYVVGQEKGRGHRRGHGQFVYVFPTSSQALSRNDPDSPVQVVGVDGSGCRLFEVGVERKRPEALDLFRESGAFQLTVPLYDELRGLQLWVHKRLVHECTGDATGAAPPPLEGGPVEVAAPRAGDTADDIRLTVGASVGIRHYAIQVGKDNRWQTIACGMGEAPREFVLDRREFGGARAVDVRILAGTGWTETEIVRDTVPLAVA
jgi:hypothetical protein